MDIKNITAALMLRKTKEAPKQLVTKWGEKLIGSGDTPLTEYPRPHMKRQSYINLNGWWRYAFTQSRVRPLEYEGSILVPFSPESYLSTVGKMLMPGACLWYIRELMVDHLEEYREAGKRCFLHFGAVDQMARVYINQHFVGEHMGGYLPFSFEITDALIQGKNEICVMVRDDTDTSYHARGKQKMEPSGMFYTAQSGIWQTVWMEWVPAVFMEGLKIIPDFDKKTVRLQWKISGSQIKEDIKLTVSTKNGLVLEARTNRRYVELPIPEDKFHPWSPENPFLYRVVLQCGQDQVQSYFAMRKVEIRRGKAGTPSVWVNDAPYFMNGVLDQGYWPESLMTPPSDDALISDIVRMKKMGFNTIRKHCKIESARWYYHCDRIGMLVWQDMVNGGGAYHSGLVTYLPTVLRAAGASVRDTLYDVTSRSDPEGRREWIQECRETVRALSHFPCIVMWVLFNEGWGQFDSRRIYQMVKKWDKSRLIDHASGWFDQGIGDFKSEHNYFHPYEMKRERRPYILSEYGGYSMRIKEHSYSRNIYGYRQISEQKEFKREVAKLHQTIQRLKDEGMSGAIYTQLSDIEEEMNGILTYDRKINKWEECGLDSKYRDNGNGG